MEHLASTLPTRCPNKHDGTHCEHVNHVGITYHYRTGIVGLPQRCEFERRKCCQCGGSHTICGLDE